MKKLLSVASILMMLVAIAACKQEKTEEGMAFQTLEIADSSRLLKMSLMVTMPAGTDSASLQICDSLLESIRCEVNMSMFQDEGAKMTRLATATHSAQDIAKEYFKGAFRLIGNEALKLEEENLEFMKADTTLTESEIEERTSNMPRWEWELVIDTLKDCSTDNYIVFNASGYAFFGGAHGGVTGRGTMIFNRKTGAMFTQFFKNNDDKELQKLLVNGLVEYFSAEDKNITAANLGDCLLVPVAELSTPASTPCPTKEGLSFSYIQYEIAPYAAGMPNFTIAYDKLKPFLTDEALQMLGL